MRALLQALARYLHTLPGVPDACAQAVLDCQGEADAATQPARSSTPAIVGFVDEQLRALIGDVHTEGSSSTATLIDWLGQYHQRLPWRRPGFNTLPASLSARLAVCELIGPDGLYHDPDVRIGVLLQAADTHYPWHQHAAEEWYGVLSGDALWSREQATPALETAGACIHHPPWIAHATETRACPLLAVWVWCGDIRGEQYRLLNHDAPATGCRVSRPPTD